MTTPDTIYRHGQGTVKIFYTDGPAIEKTIEEGKVEIYENGTVKHTKGNSVNIFPGTAIRRIEIENMQPSQPPQAVAEPPQSAPDIF